MNVFLKEKEAKENLISTALIGVGGYLVHMPPAYWLYLEPHRECDVRSAVPLEQLVDLCMIDAKLWLPGCA